VLTDNWTHGAASRHTIALQNVLLFVSSISVGNGKLQKERHSPMMSLFAVLNKFTENLITKSRECSSALIKQGITLKPV